MGTEVRWPIEARAFITTVNGRVCYAVVTEDGLVHHAALEVTKTAFNAFEEILLLLREHPDLRDNGVNFATNDDQLRTVLLSDHRIAGAHVTVYTAKQVRPHEPLMQEAKAQAHAAIAEIPLLAATDGAYDKRNAGYGWVTETGEYGFANIRARSALEAELVAIRSLLDGTSPAQPLTVVVDSRAALKLARAALGLTEYPTTPTNATGAVLDAIRKHHDRTVVLRWVRGHDEESTTQASLLNKCADSLATHGRREESLYNDGSLVEEFAARTVHETLQLAS